jgi:hypothetical protein
MVVLLTALALAASSPLLASPAFSTLNVSPETGAFCNEHLAQQLGTRGLQVTTARQIGAMLGLESQRQLSGCPPGDEGSCLAELSAALGAKALIVGDLGRLGSRYQLNVRVIAAGSTRVLASASRTVYKEEALFGALDSLAAELAPLILEALGPRVELGPRHWPLVPTFIAGGLLIASGVGYGLAFSAHQSLTAGGLGSLTPEQASSTANRGELSQWVGLGALIGVGVSLVVATVWYLLSAEPVRQGVTP